MNITRNVYNEKDIAGLKSLFIIVSLLFITPSIIYLFKYKSIEEFGGYFNFFLTKNNSFLQALVYISIVSLLIFLFVLIIKNHKVLFKNIKEVYVFVAIIGSIFIFALPIMSSDIFYYLGIGRIDATYNQNPYYTSVKKFLDTDNNSEYLYSDSVLRKAETIMWSSTTVVYGPVWTFACKIVAGMSIGDIELGVFIFKLLNLLIHMLNVYLIYKITNKKIFALLYGLNPYVLIEGIVNIHNDIMVVAFILLSLYFVLKKKNLFISIIFLAVATAIKYFPVLFLPFIVIYFYREKRPLQRFKYCLLYGLEFIAVLILLYLPYIQDLSVLNGILAQQGKYAKNFYIVLVSYFDVPGGINIIVNKVLLIIFFIAYIISCIKLLVKKDIKFRIEARSLYWFLFAFIFLLITNFQPWYIIWIFSIFMWQSSNTIKFSFQVGFISLIANTIFFIEGSDDWKYAIPFTFIMAIGFLTAIIINQKNEKEKMKKILTKICNSI